MGAFSRDFTINLAPQCRAFSRALKIEKLKAPLFPGPEGAAHTNGWCIKSLATALQFMEVVSTTFGLLVHRYLPEPPPPISLDGDSATIRNFGQNVTNRSRNGKSAVEAQ